MVSKADLLSKVLHHLLFDIWLIRLAVFERTDREQWQAQIAHFFEQAVQGGLVDHQAGKKRIAVFFQRDGQALEPVAQRASRCPLRRIS